MKLSKFQILLVRIAIGALLLIAAIFLQKTYFDISLALYITAYVILGYDVIYTAITRLFQAKFLAEDFLMSLATMGAFAIAEYPEAVAVMLFYQAGEAVSERAEARTRRSISEVMDIRPEIVTVIREGGHLSIDPATVEVGEIILISPGERIALDAEVIEGYSHVDTSALTGEALPRSVTVGDQLISGTLNQSGVLKARVLKVLEDSTVSKVLKLVEEASARKASQERFITRFARVYTPIVVVLSLLILIIPTVFFQGSFSDWLYRALTFLVVSCPCALVISVPLAFFGGIGGAARQGVLIKGGNYLEQLAKLGTIIFDKTGTLTEGRFSISDYRLFSEDYSYEEVLSHVAHAESFSTHPIAQSLVRASKETLDLGSVSDVLELSGNGVSAKVGNRRVAVGSPRFIRTQIKDESSLPDKINQTDGLASYVYVSIDETLIAEIELSDLIRNEAAESLLRLSNLGVDRRVILSGDYQAAVDKVAQTLNITEAKAELLPQDKVYEAQRIIDEEHTMRSQVAVVGDGINDAPMLALSDLGIAMGAYGSDAAIEAADIVIMSDTLERIPTAIEIARKTKAIAAQNIVFSLGIKIAVILLAALGHANILLAIMADVGVALVAILNSTRALYLKSESEFSLIGKSLVERGDKEGTKNLAVQERT